MRVRGEEKERGEEEGRGGRRREKGEDQLPPRAEAGAERFPRPHRPGRAPSPECRLFSLAVLLLFR